jgi:hypothetical protein
LGFGSDKHKILPIVLCLFVAFLCISALCAIAALALLSYRGEDAAGLPDYRDTIVNTNPGYSNEDLDDFLKQRRRVAIADLYQ